MTHIIDITRHDYDPSCRVGFAHSEHISSLIKLIYGLIERSDIKLIYRLFH